MAQSSNPMALSCLQIDEEEKNIPTTAILYCAIQSLVIYRTKQKIRQRKLETGHHPNICRIISFIFFNPQCIEPYICFFYSHSDYFLLEFQQREFFIFLRVFLFRRRENHVIARHYIAAFKDNLMYKHQSIALCY
jgi:hypothetical protein